MQVVPGDTLRLIVDVATGLSPPPGIQEDRAHRAFAVRLCARGMDLGAGALRCAPLRVHNVRPLDATSLRYRVEALLPEWFAPGAYRVDLRFPGGEATVEDGVQVLRPGADAGSLPACAVEGQAAGGFAMRAASTPCLARLHVGPLGIRLSGARFEASPLPGSAGGFDDGFVALVALAPGTQAFVTKRQARPRLGLWIEASPVFAGAEAALALRGAPADAAVFWWFGAGHGARGARVNTTFLYPGPRSVQALAVLGDGRVQRVRRELPIWQRRAFGCSLTPPFAPYPRLSWTILGVSLLWIALSRKLRPPSFRRARRLLERRK